jgi:DNA-directed RNA polymerase specialized sigma24 family protein
MAGPDSQRRPFHHVADEAIDDDDAPISEPRPSSPAADPSILDGPARWTHTDAPLPDDSGSFAVVDLPDEAEASRAPVTRALTNVFLANKSTQARIREVVEARVPRGTQEADVKDILQQANERALMTRALARSIPGMRPWVSRIAQNAVIDHFRSNAYQLKWLDRSVDVQELPPDEAMEGVDAEVPPEDPTAPPRPVEEPDDRMLGRWLAENVITKADRLTLEMIERKAASKKTNAELAAEFGVTEDAYDRRVQRFKLKWIPLWKRHQRRKQQTLMLLLLGALVLAAAVTWWLLHRAVPAPLHPTLIPVVTPAPTASAAPPPFDHSNPTQPNLPDGPKGP